MVELGSDVPFLSLSAVVEDRAACYVSPWQWAEGQDRALRECLSSFCLAGRKGWSQGRGWKQGVWGCQEASAWREKSCSCSKGCRGGWVSCQSSQDNSSWQIMGSFAPLGDKALSRGLTWSHSRFETWFGHRVNTTGRDPCIVWVSGTGAATSFWVTLNSVELR